MRIHRKLFVPALLMTLTSMIAPFPVPAAPVPATEIDTPLLNAVEFIARGGLPNVFDKLEKSAAVKIAYLGGSITAQNGWRI